MRSGAGALALSGAVEGLIAGLAGICLSEPIWSLAPRAQPPVARKHLLDLRSGTLVREGGSAATSTPIKQET